MPARSRPRPPLGQRFRLEPLEDRVTPALTSVLAGLTATINGDAAADTFLVTVDTATAGGPLLMHNRFTIGDAGFVSNLDWDSAAVGEQTLAATVAVTLDIQNLGSGDDTLQIVRGTDGVTGNGDVNAAILVNNLGADTGDSIVVDDSARSAASTYTYSTSAISFTGPGYNVTLNAFHFGGFSLTTGQGGDTINIAGTFGLSQEVNLASAGGADTVNVGDAGSLAGLNSAVIVVNSNGLTTLNIDASADAAATYTITNAQIASNLATGPINYTAAQISAINLTTGTAADTINITSTGTPTNVNAGAGNDVFTFNDGATLSGGTINGGADTDTVNYTAYTTAVAVNLGLGVTGLTATLDGGQENPGNGQPGTGTATFSNYNAITKTFDISVTVTNLNPALVTGYHIHRAGVGANGPIIIPLDTLFGLGALIPSGTGFTFNATGVSLAASLLGGAANEASFLGGQTYLNFHTAAFPGGEIRGQIFATANVNLANGTATGTAGIAAVENAIGGSGADSLVGSFVANTLSGLGGNDTILGGPGADTFVGGADNDVMIWSNGDGSDVMDGQAGSDTVAVNGGLAANDVFTIGANGTRVAFARVSPGPFTLDIGTTETLTVNGIVGDDSFTMNSLAGVSDLTAVGLNGLAGNDTFTVTPFSGTTTVRGGLGTDTLNVTTAGTTNPFVTTAADVASGRIGGFAFGNRGPVNFTQTETPAAPANFVTVTKTDGQTTATAGTSIIYTVTVTNTSTLGVNGITVTDALPAALTGVTWAAVFTAGSTGTAAGSGNINQVVNLAAGGSVTYSIVATISPAFVGTLSNTATAAVPAGLTDNTAADDTATDTTTVALPPPPPPVDLYATATGPGVPVRVDVFNANGTLRFSLNPFGGFGGGASLATGDVTGDGIDDIAVGAGAGGGPHVKVFDGASGAEIRSFFAYAEGFTGGVSVALGDIDGDGRAEILTGAGAGGGPHVKAFDGRTGAEVLSFYAYDSSFSGGVNVAAGDLDGDNRDEIISGARAGGGPHVKAFDGRTGAEVRSFFAYDPSFGGGVNVAAGDLDGDGRDEIITGAGAGGGPHVKAFDGRTGAERLSFFAFDPGFAGGVNVAATDLNGDNRDELVVGAGPGGGPHVRVLSSTLQEQASFFAFDPAFLGGVPVG